MHQIADAAWRCADPGVQYDTTINRWHTCPESGRINASNPCSEYMHVDDSACNLASLNLMKFRRDDGTFDVDDFEHAVDIVFLAQEIVVGPSSYPTEEIGRNARAFRQLGLGYANLGALLMSDGLPYDSDEGRAVAAAITALMTGRGYRRSAEVAAAIGPYDEYPKNREPHNSVMRMHRDAGLRDPRRLRRGRPARRGAPQLGRGGRARRAPRLPQRPGDRARPDRDDQLPDGLRHDRHRARLLAGQVQGAGRRRADDDRQPLGAAGAADARLLRAEIEQIEAHINEHATIIGAPGLKDEHLPVFDVAVGERAISHTGHIDMMAATQPFISGAISKTVNLPGVGDGRGHRRRLHPRLEGRPEGAGDLPRRLEDGAGAAHRRPGQGRTRARPRRRRSPERRKMPRERESITHKFSIAGHEGYITAGKYEDGSLGEIFLTDIGKEGSTLRGHDERLRDRDLDRPPVRGAARDLRAQVQLHALRAGGDHPATRRSRSPSRCPTTSCAGSAAASSTTPTSSRSSASSPTRSAPSARPSRRCRSPRKAPALERRQRHPRANGNGNGRAEARPTAAPSRPPRRSPTPRRSSRPRCHDRRPRPGLRPVRRHDAAHRLLLHVLELRQQHRLRLRGRRPPAGGPPRRVFCAGFGGAFGGALGGGRWCLCGGD